MKTVFPSERPRLANCNHKTSEFNLDHGEERDIQSQRSLFLTHTRITALTDSSQVGEDAEIGYTGTLAQKYFPYIRTIADLTNQRKPQVTTQHGSDRQLCNISCTPDLVNVKVSWTCLHIQAAETHSLLEFVSICLPERHASGVMKHRGVCDNFALATIVKLSNQPTARLT